MISLINIIKEELKDTLTYGDEHPTMDDIRGLYNNVIQQRQNNHNKPKPTNNNILNINAFFSNFKKSLDVYNINPNKINKKEILSKIEDILNKNKFD